MIMVFHYDCANAIQKRRVCLQNDFELGTLAVQLEKVTAVNRVPFEQCRQADYVDGFLSSS